MSLRPCHQLIVRIWRSTLEGCTPFDRDRDETWIEEFCAYADPIALTMNDAMNSTKSLKILTHRPLPVYAVASLSGGVAGEDEGLVSGRIAKCFRYPIGYVSEIERSPLPFKIGTAADCQVNPRTLRSDCHPC